MSPLSHPASAARSPLGLDAIVAEALSRSNMLVRGNLRLGTHLACGVLLRGGSLALGDAAASVRRLAGDVALVPWNPDGFKVSLCGQPSPFAPASGLLLSNNAGVAVPLGALYNRFLAMYRVRAHVHHYLEYMDGGAFLEAAEAVYGCIKSYEEV